VSGPDADAIAAAALQSPMVASLATGRIDEVATYLPGRRVAGVRVADDEIEVHVVARWDSVFPELAASVQQAVASAAGGLPVAVHIDDIETPTSDGV
jgi:hypothetical protein